MKCTPANIGKLLKKWRPILGLNPPSKTYPHGWEIRIKSYPKELWPEDWNGFVAMTEATPGYWAATIHLNAQKIEEAAETLEEILVHELVHIPTWELSAIARDALGDAHSDHYKTVMERMVETISAALLAAGKR